DPARRHLLEVHERLDGCRVPAAELGWVAGHHPPVVEQRRLPVTGPLRDDVARLVLGGREVVEPVRLGWKVLVEERDELGAERLLLGTPSEVHRRTALALSPAGRT